MGRVIQAERSSDGDGWKASYSIVRDDGVQVVVTLDCSGTAEAVARAHGNADALETMHDQGQAFAQELAETAQGGRGMCRIHVFFDELGDGSPQHSYAYEKPVPSD